MDYGTAKHTKLCVFFLTYKWATSWQNQQNDMCAQQKTQISLGIRPVRSVFTMRAQWVAKILSFLHADSWDSVQTGRMPRLIWVFAGRTCHAILLVLSGGGSNGFIETMICGGGGGGGATGVNLQNHVFFCFVFFLSWVLQPLKIISLISG